MAVYPLKINRYPVRAGKGRLRVVHLTDLHLDDTADLSWLRMLVERVNGEQPYMIFFTGDFATHQHPYRTASDAVAILRRLEAPLGKFAVRGNHDVYGAAGQAPALIQSAGFVMLQNEVVSARTADGRPVWIGGLDTARYRWENAEVRRVLPLRAHRDALRILLMHEPKVAQRVPVGTADLMLAGHTHQGQLHVLGMERLWLPPLSGRYVHGFYTVHHMPLYVSAGLGESGPRVRFCVPREAVTFDFV